MSDAVFAVFAGVTLLVSALLTGWLRRFAISRRLLDVPNARSSHVMPTPRGGGVAVVLTMLAAMPLLAGSGALAPALLQAVLGGGALVAVVGWLDDRGDVAAHWRLLVHFTAAGWALVSLGGLPPMSVFGAILDLGWLGQCLGALYLVWLLNLYNFMDGIDGIAGVEAVTVCLGGAALYILTGASGEAWMPPVLLAAAVGGFLFWNFPRARIFMGDAGSGFIGMMLGLFALDAGSRVPELFWAWLILLGAFIVDATLTLLRRLTRGKRVYQAHRSHAYQHAARRLGSHIPVTLVLGAINVFWLLPLAAVVVTGRLDGAAGVLLAWTPLVWLALRCGAGTEEQSGHFHQARADVASTR
jgi:Fuc2NAc and GlcNAc transferase